MITLETLFTGNYSFITLDYIGFFRTLMFVKNNFNYEIPFPTFTDDEKAIVTDVNVIIGEYLECMEKQKLRDGLKCVLKLSSLGNSYIQAGKPWELMKSNETK